MTVYIIRAEVPLLWVEYSEEDETLKEGEVFAVHPTLDLFQVEDIIPLVGGGIILALRASPKVSWPEAGDQVTYLKVHQVS